MSSQAGAATSFSAPSPSGRGHAVLHDFCMTIPYGSLLAVAGVVLLPLGASQAGITALVAGLAIVLSSYLSMSAWKKGRNSALFTLASGGLASYVAYTCYNRIQQGVSTVPSGIAFVASAAAALFCLYNILAGGNPPKKQALD